MKIGSNNSLTYLEPSSWWFKIFRWLVRKQELSYDTQYSFWGIRMFDFRICFGSKNRIMVRDGKHKFRLDSFYEILDYFDKREDVIVRITLDAPKEELTQGLETKFKQTCHLMDAIYEHIGFFGGYSLHDKKVIYKFDWEHKNGTPILICPTEWSRIYNFVCKWLPFWVRRFNQVYINRYNNNDGYLMINYVNRR